MGIRRAGSSTWYGKSPWYTTPRKWKTAGLPPGLTVSYDNRLDMDLYGTVPASVYEPRFIGAGMCGGIGRRWGHTG